MKKRPNQQRITSGVIPTFSKSISKKYTVIHDTWYIVHDTLYIVMGHDTCTWLWHLIHDTYYMIIIGTWYMIRCTWSCMVYMVYMVMHDTWSYGTWYMIRFTWLYRYIVQGTWYDVHGHMVHGLWYVLYGYTVIWYKVHDTMYMVIWYMVYDTFYMVIPLYGTRCMIRGTWTYGTWYVVYGHGTCFWIDKSSNPLFWH